MIGCSELTIATLLFALLEVIAVLVLVLQDGLLALTTVLVDDCCELMLTVAVAGGEQLFP